MSKIVGMFRRSRLVTEQAGQDALEYLLVIGVVMTVVVAAVAAGFTPGTLVSAIFTDLQAEIVALI